jgi:transmembrane sensor
MTGPEEDREPTPRTAEGWVTREHSGRMTAGDRRALIEWLAQSPENTRDYTRADVVWRMCGGLSSMPEVQAELEDIRRSVTVPEALPPPEKGTPRRHWLWLIALSLPLAAAVVIWYARTPSTELVTAPGEQRSVTLADGSLVAMNTDTRLRVELGRRSRLVTVENGEALFQITPDGDRPFTVRARQAMLRAVGTRFDVMVESKQVTVAVLDGEVEVSRRNEPEAARTIVHQGEAVALSGDGELTRADPLLASADRIRAWRAGKLDFDDWPLERVVRDHNRYAVKPIRVADASLQRLHVSGVFRIGDTTALLDAMRELTPLAVRDEGDEFVLVPLAAERENPERR